MAEILVESTVGQQRSAFQFDTITPKKKTALPNSTDYNDAPLSSVMMDSGIEIPSTSTEVTKETSTNHDSSKEDSSAKSSSESDDNGGFVTPEEGQGPSKSHHRVKRATVVGNPMFSASQDSEIAATGENLGLDDLDYDDIMHYFDNLKVNKR
jgi:transmembrane protein 132